MKIIFENLTDGQATLLIGVIALASGFIGGGLTALLGYLKDRGAAAHEMRKLAIEAGLESWRHRNLLMVDVMKSNGRGGVTVDEPDAYIMHMLRVIHIASNMKVSGSGAANNIARWNGGAITSEGKPASRKEGSKNGKA